MFVAIRSYLMIANEYGTKMIRYLCKVRPKFMNAMNSVGAKEVNYVRIESIHKGITAVFRRHA